MCRQYQLFCFCDSDLLKHRLTISRECLRLLSLLSSLLSFCKSMAKILKILGNDPNSPLTLRSLIDPKRAWIIIGPQGSSHKSLQIRHGVYITLHSTFDEPVGRLCSVTGTALSVSRAYKEIILMLFEKRRSNPPLTVRISKQCSKLSIFLCSVHGSTS